MNMNERNTLRRTKVGQRRTQLRASLIARLECRWQSIHLFIGGEVVNGSILPEEEVVSFLPNAAAKPSSEANTLPFVVAELIPLNAWFCINGTILGAIDGNACCGGPGLAAAFKISANGLAVDKHNKSSLALPEL